MFSSLQPVGKILVVAGIVMVAVGLLLHFIDRIPFIGKLPGDILIQKKNFTFYFPIMTTIILSILLTLIFYLIRKIR